MGTFRPKSAEIDALEQTGTPFWFNNSSVHKPDGDHADCNNFVGAVEADAEKVLLFAVAVVADARNYILGIADTGSFREEAAAGELEGRGYLGCLCVSNTGDCPDCL